MHNILINYFILKSILCKYSTLFDFFHIIYKQPRVVIMKGLIWMENFNNNCKPEHTCPTFNIDGVISGGKQFDLDITLPEDNRDAIYGIVKNCFKEPVKNAVVKLVEIVYDCGKTERRPVGHTFTDKDGEFVFGPLCPGRNYAIQIWVNDTENIKICSKCHHEGECLKGEKIVCPKECHDEDDHC